MALWFLFAVMTALAVLAVLWPLSRGRSAPAAGSDVAVYRDQLEEIERDRAAGLIGNVEADAARVEVSRRLLAADAGARDASAPAPGALGRRRAAAVAALIGIPAVALGLYLAVGSPALPGAPLAARLKMPQGHQSIEALVAQVEDRLAKHPEDGRGWEVLAPIYLRMGRFTEAADAWRHVIAAEGETAERQANLGEALTGSQNGVVTAEARQAFTRAVALDPKEPKARYYIGLAAQQDGKPDEAARDWRAMLADAPAGAPWVSFVRESLAHVDPKVAAEMQASAAAPSAAGAPSAPGPSAAAIAAAQDMAPEQRQQMIRGMVERLAERLKQDGADGEGWVRLVRAYAVLGERDKAREAAADARRALQNDPQDLQRIDDVVKQLGIEG